MSKVSNLHRRASQKNLQLSLRFVPQIALILLQAPALPLPLPLQEVILP